MLDVRAAQTLLPQLQRVQQGRLRHCTLAFLENVAGTCFTAFEDSSFLFCVFAAQLVVSVRIVSGGNFLRPMAYSDFRPYK